MPLPPNPLGTPGLPASTTSDLREILNNLVDWIVKRVPPASDAPYDLFSAAGTREKPFMYGLFPMIVRGSEIERSLSTKLGDVMRDAAVAIARGGGFEAYPEHRVSGRLGHQVLPYIRELVRKSRPGSERPNLREELATIRGLNRNQDTDQAVTIDLFVATGDDEYYFDLKTPQPNSDQPRDMKDRLMQARALRMPKTVSAYAVFYYNPKGLAGAYTIGQKYLDYAGGEVLVGKAFWDFIGGDGAYAALVRLFAQVGSERRAELDALVT